MKHILLSVFLVSFLFSCVEKKEPVDYVDPTIGNLSHLLVPTFPTVHLPGGMLRMYALRVEGLIQDKIGGYPLSMASHRQGAFFSFQPLKADAVVPVGAQLSHDNEKTQPYFYQADIDEHEVNLAFAPSYKSGIFVLDYNKAECGKVRLNTMTNGSLVYKDGHFEGVDAFNGLKCYVYGEFSTQPIAVETAERGAAFAKSDAVSGSRVSMDITFDKGQSVSFRYGMSFISHEQAKANLNKEIATWDIKSVALEGRKAWNEALGKIKAEGDEDKLTIFYTALYRCYERPVNIREYNNQYFSGYDNQVHDSRKDFYVDDWCWDTYLALHPLHVIINPDMQIDRINSFISQWEQSGRMPTFPIVSGDAHFMNGNHYVSLFWDAWCKGLRNFDLNKAFEGSKHTILHTSMLPWVKAPACDLDSFYHQNGWYPSLKVGEKETNPLVNAFENRQAVTLALAASYDDWCLANMAKELGKSEDHNLFTKRSYNYRNHWNKETCFFQPKDNEGNWIEPFDPIYGGGVGAREYFAENNAWTYIWDVHHNIADLIDLFGSKQAFEKKLDQLFVEGIKRPRWQYYGVMPDATGGIGQFVMGNEPSFHIPYLYNYIGAPWKTQKRIRTLMDQWFRSDIMGICGDEDGGGMSAFYIFSAMGFYPVTPGLPFYTIGSPNLDYAKIDVGNGKSFEVKVTNNSSENKYIQSVTLNGVPLNRTWITHDDVVSGGVMELNMGGKPNKSWGVGEGAIPPSFSMN